jgi:hypothetical protein
MFWVLLYQDANGLRGDAETKRLGTHALEINEFSPNVRCAEKGAKSTSWHSIEINETYA